MKTVPFKKTLNLFYCLLAAVLFVTASAFSGSSNPPASGAEARYSIEVNKTQNSKKHKIRLYSDTGKGLLFTVNGTAGSHYQLFIFDMDSRLVMQASIHNREIAALNAISRGSYLFEVLMDDQQIERGRLVVK